MMDDTGWERYMGGVHRIRMEGRIGGGILL